MAELGLSALYIALGLALYSVAASIIGKWKEYPELIESGVYSTYLSALSLLISSFCLVAGFITHDFGIAYVYSHSNLAMPKAYTWVAMYAGNEGSLLFIATSLSILSSIALVTSPHNFKPWLPYTNAILMTVLVFFLSVMALLANPFATLDPVPIDGLGINPLLLHPGMFIHPPVLMTGLIMVTVPFSFALGSLISKRTRDQWVDAGRVWGILAWATLGSGLLLGSWWAYTILGWGGYWAWDPVENAGFMPWLGLTAFIHSIMVQKRLGMFRMWNMALINITFVLALFGMFINRGGPVPSVHSFAASSLGWVFLAFLIVGTIIPFTLFFIRFNHLKSNQYLESTLSREAAFLVNNLFLLGIAFVTLWGVIYPLISQLFTGFTVTVGESFYNQVNGPLMLGLIFLMGVGPLIPWRRSNIQSLRNALLTPMLIGVMVILIMFLFGINKPYVLTSFGLMTIVTIGILREWIRGTMVLRRHGENYLSGFLKLIVSNRPRYGGYIVHLAIISLAAAIVGSSFYSTQSDITLSPGQRIDVNNYTITYLNSETLHYKDRVESRFFLDISNRNGPEETLTPFRIFYPSFNMSSTRAGIISSPIEDFYIVPGEIRSDTEDIIFRVFDNPLMWWMWVAGPIMIIGTLIALWPTRSHNLRASPNKEEVSYKP